MSSKKYLEKLKQLEQQQEEEEGQQLNSSKTHSSQKQEQEQEEHQYQQKGSKDEFSTTPIKIRCSKTSTAVIKEIVLTPVIDSKSQQLQDPASTSRRRAKQEEEEEEEECKKKKNPTSKVWTRLKKEFEYVQIDKELKASRSPQLARREHIVSNREEELFHHHHLHHHQQQEEEQQQQQANNSSSISNLNETEQEAVQRLKKKLVEELPPILQQVIQEWKSVSEEASIRADKFESSVTPELPDSNEIYAFSELIRSSLDKNGLAALDRKSTQKQVPTYTSSSLDSNSNNNICADGDADREEEEEEVEVVEQRDAREALRRMERINQELNRIADATVSNYHSRELALLRQLVKAQHSQIRALKADIDQIKNFMMYKIIGMNRILAVCHSFNAAVARSISAADIERSTQREKFLPQQGRTNLFLTSRVLSKREEIELHEKLRALPFLTDGLHLFELVQEIEDASKPAADLASAFNQIRTAETLSQKVLASMRSVEEFEESAFSEMYEKYKEVTSKMSGAEIVDDDESENENNNNASKKKKSTSSSENQEGESALVVPNSYRKNLLHKRVTTRKEGVAKSVV